MRNDSGQKHTRPKGNVEEWLIKLGKITNEVINSFAKQKVDGKTINVADIYFILSGALQQVSYMNASKSKNTNKRKHSTRK